MPDKIHVLNVSFIMKKFRREFGGTGGNIAYSLSLLGTPTELVGTAGKDFGPYMKHLSKNVNLNTSGIRQHKSLLTASGFVMTDQNDNQIWGFYEGAMKKSEKINIGKHLKTDSFLVIAPNDPVAMIKYSSAAMKTKTPYLFDPAFNIPHFSKNNLSLAVSNAEILIGNDYEIELIKRKLNWTTQKLTKSSNIIITTLGSKGSLIQQAGKMIRIPPAKPKNNSDPTGAGDAYRAGFLAGYFRGLTLEVCGRMGSIASVYTVEKYGTQTHQFTLKQFAARYKQSFDKLLDI